MFFFFSSRRRHTIWPRDWSSDVCSSDLAKLANIRRHGARVHFCRPDQASREAALDALAQQGLEAIPPYDDDRIIAGQGSTALEMVTQVDELDDLVVPDGRRGPGSGGGLAAPVRE